MHLICELCKNNTAELSKVLSDSSKEWIAILKKTDVSGIRLLCCRCDSMINNVEIYFGPDQREETCIREMPQLTPIVKSGESLSQHLMVPQPEAEEAVGGLSQQIKLPNKIPLEIVFSEELQKHMMETRETDEKNKTKTLIPVRLMFSNDLHGQKKLMATIQRSSLQAKSKIIWVCEVCYRSYRSRNSLRHHVSNECGMLL